MRKSLTVVLSCLYVIAFAANESAATDPCTPIKKQVQANFEQIQAYKTAGQDAKIPALHQANVALRKANPNCFSQ